MWAAPQYLTRFRCTGGDCEDNCCAYAWTVPVSQDDYVRLEQTLAGTPEDRERFARGCLRTPAAGAPSYAALAKTTAGRCTFLDSDGLCSVHRTLGAAALPDVCALYPRDVIRTAGGGTVAGLLSCPEAARLCLLNEDAMTLVPCDPPRLSGARPTGGDPRDAQWPHVRDPLLRLLTTPGYSFATRCYFAAAFAERLDVSEATGFDQALAQTQSPDWLAALDHDFRHAAPAPSLALALVNQILIAAMQVCDAPKFLTLLDGVYAPYVLDDATISGKDVWAGYAARRRRWEARFAPRIDRALTNYTVNACLRSPYDAAATLLSHLLQLYVAIDTWRFLMFCHPSLDQSPTATDAAERLDRVLVESCYLLTRAIDHSRAFRREIARVLEVNGVNSLPHAALLLAM